MLTTQLRRALNVLCVTSLLSVAGGFVACKKEPSRWDEAAQAPLPPKPSDAVNPGDPAKPSDPVQPVSPAQPEKPGSAFNAAFPADGVDGYARVFTQEKEGFAEAKLEKDGQTAATLAISDAANDQTVKAKFERAADKLDGYPLVTVGKNQSALLVADRYQVKVSSQTLDADARKALLSKFDLKALASR